MNYRVGRISAQDKRSMKQVRKLIEQEGIALDANLDETWAVFDDDGAVIATGSCFANTLRCFAVSSEHQGEGVLNELISVLTERQSERGFIHLFIYTKCSSAKFFASLGFYEIARVEHEMVFMENRKTGFLHYLKNLERETERVLRACNTRNTGSVAAIVMNANPFTLGHQYLIKRAASENGLVHLFIVSEEASLFPADARKKLVEKGTEGLNNVICHDTDSYMISNATFPSYFLKDEAAVIKGHAELDLAIFLKIAEALGITRRYVGEEPKSIVTGIYNQIMEEKLPTAGVECVVIPRKEKNGEAISASLVRQCIKENKWGELKALVPESTYLYLISDEAKPVIDRIQAAEEVRHY